MEATGCYLYYRITRSHPKWGGIHSPCLLEGNASTLYRGYIKIDHAGYHKRVHLKVRGVKQHWLGQTNLDDRKSMVRIGVVSYRYHLLRAVSITGSCTDLISRRIKVKILYDLLPKANRVFYEANRRISRIYIPQRQSMERWKRANLHSKSRKWKL